MHITKLSAKLPQSDGFILDSGAALLYNEVILNHRTGEVQL